MVHNKVVCLNWGNKYPPKYVEVLESMVKRHLTIPYEFICLTDKPEKYKCKTVKLPVGLKGWWNKTYLFYKDLFEAGKVLFLDLDIVIVENIDELFDFEGFTAIKDWNFDVYNSSVMILGKNPEIWDDFTFDVSRRLHGDQDWITEKIPYRRYFPSEWILSYRKSCAAGVPLGCKIVVFHGKPKPHEIKHGWVPELWK